MVPEDQFGLYSRLYYLANETVPFLLPLDSFARLSALPVYA
jgi:hypothetical protein